MSSNKKPNERRRFIKTVVVGSASISFVKLASSSESVSPIDAVLGAELVVTPVAGENRPQTVNVPVGAKSMNLYIKGASGGGARARTGGSAGGDTSFYTRDLIDVSDTSQLILHVGEGGHPGESTEFGVGGEFGGGDGGPNIDLPGGQGSNVTNGGGGGGGYSAILQDDIVMVVAAGGGGAGNRSTGAPESLGGKGGNSDNFGEHGRGGNPGKIPEGGIAGGGIPRTLDGKSGLSFVSNDRLQGSLVGSGGRGGPSQNAWANGAGGGGGGGLVGGGGGGQGSRGGASAELGIIISAGAGGGGGGGLSYRRHRLTASGETGNIFASGAPGDGVSIGQSGEVRITFSSTPPVINEKDPVITPAINLLLDED